MRDELDDLKRHPATLKLYTQRLRFERRGKEYFARCPFHSEKTGSFSVSQKDGAWLYECFGCHEGGNVIQFVQKMDKISFKEAVQKVKEYVGGSWDAKKEQVEQTFKPLAEEEEAKVYKSYSLEEYAATEKKLLENPAAIKWLKEERGIDLDTARRMHVGFRQSIAAKDPTLKDIIDKGWIVFPCIEGDRVVSLKYRSIVRKAFARQPGMMTALFNVDTIDPLEPLYITEGEPDAIVLEQAGYRAISLPNSTWKLTPDMRDKIKNAGRIVLAGDGDFVGTQAMEKLWAELGDDTFLLRWPEGFKDANALWKKSPNLEAFKAQIEDLTQQAYSQPIPGVYSLTDAMLVSSRMNLSDHPHRLRFDAWPTVDRMAILLPGSVMSVFATNTKMGKTAFVMDFTVDGAVKHQEVVLNYQVELTTDEFANIVAAHVLQRDRNHLTEADYHEAALFLKKHDVHYYIGRNPMLNTVTPVLDLIEAAIQRLGATIVVLDHIHFICRNEENEVQAQANAMQRIKNMAVKYKVKFVVVGQPRKAKQDNRGKLVHITDWKGSESGVSDADAIFAIHREYIKTFDPAHPPTDDYNPETEIRLLGARAKGDGPTSVMLQFHGDTATFKEGAPPESHDDDKGVFE